MLPYVTAEVATDVGTQKKLSHIVKSEAEVSIRSKKAQAKDFEFTRTTAGSSLLQEPAGKDMPSS